MQISARRFTFSLLCPQSRKDFLEVSNASFHSNSQWCSSSTAAVSSDSFTPQRQKKVTRKQRKAMVLAFVEKYRALNDGKFPSAFCAKTEIGGSFYVVRSIIQELEYNHKRASLETKKEIKIREENVKCEVFPLAEQPCMTADGKQTSFKEHLNGATEILKKPSSNKSKADTKASRLSIDAQSDNQIEINSHKSVTPSSLSKENQEDWCFGFDNLHSSSTSARTTVEPQTHISDVEEMNVQNRVSAELETETSIFHTPTEERVVSEKNVSFSANLQDACCPEGKKMNNQEAFRSEELYHGQPERDEQGATYTDDSNFWGYLKSFAAGIFNRWK